MQQNDVRVQWTQESIAAFRWRYDPIGFIAPRPVAQSQVWAVGIQISIFFSEAMFLRKKSVECLLHVRYELLSQVEEFRYLRILFTNERKMRGEIDREIRAAFGSDVDTIHIYCDEQLRWKLTNKIVNKWPQWISSTGGLGPALEIGDLGRVQSRAGAPLCEEALSRGLDLLLACDGPAHTTLSLLSSLQCSSFFVCACQISNETIF